MKIPVLPKASAFRPCFLLPLLVAGCALPMPEKNVPGAEIHGSDLSGSATGTAQIPSTVMPRLVAMTNPDYPPDAKTRGVQGDVLIALTVGPDGAVSNPVIVRSPDPELSQAALDSVATWVYKPGLRNGQPGSFRLQVSLHFGL